MAIKLRALVKHPSRLDAGTGVEVEKENGITTVSVNLASLSTTASIADESLTNIVLVTPGLTDDDPDVHEQMAVDDFLAVLVASDPELAAIAGLTSAANKLPYFTGPGTAALTDFTAAARTVLDDASVGAMATTLGLGTGDSPQFTAINLGHASDTTITRVSAGVVAVEGSNVLLASGLGSITQAYDADLAALAGLTSAADKLPYFTGSATAALADFTSFGRSLVDDADATAARTTLGLAIGTDVQAYDADLAALAALTDTGILRRTGAGAATAGTTVATAEIADDAVTYAKIQDVSATARLLGRTTSGAGIIEEIDIAALATKASPAAGDYIVLSDQAASGAFKKATVSSVSAAGSVSSLNGATGAVVTGINDVQNGSLAVSAAGSELTIALKDAQGSDPSAGSPVAVNFRHATGTTGTHSTVSVTGATSLVITSGSTLGVTSSTAFRLWIVGFNDGGTFRLGVRNCLSGTSNPRLFPLPPYGVASSTAEGGAGGADSAGLFYTGTAVTSKAFIVLGYIEWSASGVTAGTWTTTNLLRIQSYGAGIPLPGHVIQKHASVSGSVASGTTTIPFDNTIPQNTEGDQFFSQAITPLSAANLLRIEHIGYYNISSTNRNTYLVLFQDSTADALASSGAFYSDASRGMFLVHEMRAGTSSSTTFKIRAGSESAGTVYLNASGAGAAYFNSTIASRLDVEEIMA